jgi:polyisoprenoid-binding protein YceI
LILSTSILAIHPLTLGADTAIFVVQKGSTIEFLSIKDHGIPVPGRFREITGEVSVEGERIQGELRVPLRSLDTGNPARDLNILRAFFEAETYPEARFQLRKVNSPELAPFLDKNKNRNAITAEVEGTLTLHGIELPVTTTLGVERVGEEVYLHSISPLVLKVEELRMGAQLKALMALCGHKDLTPLFPVVIHLRFKKTRP